MFGDVIFEHLIFRLWKLLQKIPCLLGIQGNCNMRRTWIACSFSQGQCHAIIFQYRYNLSLLKDELLVHSRYVTFLLVCKKLDWPKYQFMLSNWLISSLTNFHDLINAIYLLGLNLWYFEELIASTKLTC